MKIRILSVVICFFTVLYGSEKSLIGISGNDFLVIKIPNKFSHVLEIEGPGTPDPNHPIYKHYNWEKKEKGGWKGSLKVESVLNGFVTPED